MRKILYVFDGELMSALKSDFHERIQGFFPHPRDWQAQD